MRVGLWGWMIILSAPALTACAHRHVSLENPSTSPSARYICPADARPCSPATTDVPSERNPSRMTFFSLPQQCAGRIHKIVILEADTSTPHVDVTCAPFEDPQGGTASPPLDAPIEEMQ